MTDVSIRDLRNRGGEIIDRAARGEEIVISRNGVPVAELRPLPGPGMTADAVLTRWRGAPSIDPDAFRDDLDGLLDQRL